MISITSLFRMYSRLKVWERIPLLIAAEARGDEVEAKRLFDASPIRTWRFAEHLLSAQALNLLAMMYVNEQLEAAAGYFFAQWQFDGEEQDLEFWRFVADTNAYYFVANATAWRQFCTELGFSSGDLIEANQNGWMLQLCHERMPDYAPSADVVQARMKQMQPDCGEIVTADDLLASWRTMLQKISRHAPPTAKQESASCN